VPQQVQDFLAHIFELQPRFIRTWAATPSCSEQAQEQVFGADVVVVQVPRFLDRVVDDLLGAGRVRKPAHDDLLPARPVLNDLLDFQPNLAEVDIEVLQDVGGDAQPSFTSPSRMCSVPMYSC